MSYEIYHAPDDNDFWTHAFFDEEHLKESNIEQRNVQTVDHSGPVELVWVQNTAQDDSTDE
jgi:hypothetical protein